MLRAITALIMSAINSSAPESTKRSSHERNTEAQAILDSVAFTVIDFIKASATGAGVGPAGVDDVLIDSSSDLASNCKVSSWDLIGDFSIFSSAPVGPPLINQTNKSKPSYLTPAWWQNVFIKPQNVEESESAGHKLAKEPLLCSRCTADKAAKDGNRSPRTPNDRSNSGVSDFEGIGKGYVFEHSPANEDTWNILENAVASI